MDMDEDDSKAKLTATIAEMLKTKTWTAHDAEMDLHFNK
jgi:hypothetical protein